VKTENLLTAFVAPDTKYRSCPYWIWNGDVTEAHITERLEQYVAQGCGGVFIHARIGLITEYLSERWFELWGFALAECKRLGLTCNIYDENHFPPPSAGGHVFSRIPYAIQQSVVAESIPAGAEIGRRGKLGKHDLGDGRTLLLDICRAAATAWAGGFPYVDVLRPEVMREFIATTHDAYRQRFGDEFGTTLRMTYNDEVGVRQAGGGAGGLPMSAFLLAAFKREHRYDLAESMADLFAAREGAEATRFDYYSTVHRLMMQNYFRPLYKWCEQHNLQTTGHLWENCWPAPFDTPNCMAAYRWFHIPGVDVLGFQFFTDEHDAGGNDLILLTIKEAVSATHQLGRPRTSCEAFGGSGYEKTLLEIKRAADWFMVHGVDLVVEHLSYQSIAGTRKYDWPQTFSDHSPWWPHYRELADHMARLALVGSTGEPISRTLVLHPTTTGWTQATPLDESPLKALRSSQGALLRWLCDHQVDFDLGDEFLMAELGSAGNGVFTIGEMTYEVLVLPDGMENICESTLDLLDAYLGSGGVVLALGAAPQLVNGRPDGRPAALAATHPKLWRRVQSVEELQRQLDELVPRLITASSGDDLPTGMAHRARRVSPNATLHMIANTGAHALCTELCVEGESVCVLDTITGACRSKGTLVALQPGESTVLLASTVPIGCSPGPEQSAGETIEIAAFDAIRRTSENVLVLDFCDLTVDGVTQEGLHVVQANNLCFRAHGMDGDVWSNIQYRTNFMDRQFGDETGFDVEYCFVIRAEDFDSVVQGGPIRIAIERPHLYEVELNGSALSFADAQRWFDEAIGAVEVSTALLRPGENRVRLRARPFHILCEIDRVYILGDFGLEPASPGFRIVQAQPMGTGDWTQQGLPLFNGTVKYTCCFDLKEPAASLRVSAPVETAATVVRIDDSRPALLDFHTDGRLLAGPFDAGTHELVIEVCGTPRNLLGPHFLQTDVPHGKRVTGSFTWTWSCPDSPADGDAYELVPYGLTGPVRIIAMRGQL